MSFNKKPPKWNKGAAALSDFMKAAGWQSGDNPSAASLNNNPGSYTESIEELQSKAGRLKTINGIGANKDGALSVDIQRITSKGEFSDHSNATVYNEEVHGLRIFNGLLQHHDGKQWRDFQKQGIGQYGINGINDFTAKIVNEVGFALRWTEPADKTLKDGTAIRWGHTIIVRKEGDYPTSVNDGVQVISNGVRNQYAFQDLIDSRIDRGVSYYYSAFVYSVNGLEMPQKLSVAVYPLKDKFSDRSRIYGVEIDLNETHPSNAVTYIEAATGTTAGSDAWWERYPFAAIRPVLLENGVVDVELNPNDYTRDIHGRQVNSYISGTGDVMIEFPLLYWKVKYEGTKMRIYCSGVKHDAEYKSLAHVRNGSELDKIYIGAYDGRFARRRSDSLLEEYKEEVGEGGGSSNYEDKGFNFLEGALPFTKPVSVADSDIYEYPVETIKKFLNEGNQDRNYTLLNISHLQMIQVLFILFYKTLNSSGILGAGSKTQLNSKALDLNEYNFLGSKEPSTNQSRTGHLTKSGMNSINPEHGAFKLFGIENLFGGSRTIIDGIYVDENMNYKMGFEYLEEGNATETIASGASEGSSNIVGMLKKPHGDSRLGFLPSLASKDTTGGSNSTYYGDRFVVEKNKFMTIGYPYIPDSEYVHAFKGLAKAHAETYQKNMSGLMAITAGNENGYVYNKGFNEHIVNDSTYPDTFVVRPVYTAGVYEYSYLNFEDVNFEEYHVSGIKNMSLDDGVLRLLTTLPTSETANRIIFFDSRNYDLSQLRTTEALFNAVYRPTEGGENSGSAGMGNSGDFVVIHPEESELDISESISVIVDRAIPNIKNSRYYSYVNWAEQDFHNINSANRTHYVAVVVEHVTYTANGQPVTTYTEPYFERFDVIDLRPPRPVVRLAATKTGTNSLEVSIFAHGKYYAQSRVLILLKEDSMPEDQYDGIVVYDGAFFKDATRDPITFAIKNIDLNKKYWLRSFTFDPDGNMNDVLEEYDFFTHYCQYLGVEIIPYPAVENLRISFSTDGFIATVEWDKPVADFPYERTDIYIATEDITNMPVSDVLQSSYLAYSGPNLITTYNSIPGSTYYVRAFSYYKVDGYDQIGRGASTSRISVDTIGPGPVRDFNGIGVDKDRILISWVNPTEDYDFYKTTIVSKRNGYPTSITDGTIVYDGGGTHALVRDLAAGMTYFRAFTHDDKGNLSSHNVDSVKLAVEAKELPTVENFALGQNAEGTEVYASWKAPVTPFLESIRLYASLDANIENRTVEECQATDTLVYEGLGSSATHYFVQKDKTYHYKVFAVYDFYDIVTVSYGAYAFTDTVGSTLPPEPASNISITSVHSKNLLSWKNPSANYAKTVIVRKKDSYPNTPEDGTIVYEGTGTQLEDISIVNETTYYYRFFTYSKNGYVDTDTVVGDWIISSFDTTPPAAPTTVQISTSGTFEKGYNAYCEASELNATAYIKYNGEVVASAVATPENPYSFSLSIPANKVPYGGIIEFYLADEHGNISKSVRRKTDGSLVTFSVVMDTNLTSAPYALSGGAGTEFNSGAYNKFPVTIGDARIIGMAFSYTKRITYTYSSGSWKSAIAGSYSVGYNYKFNYIDGTSDSSTREFRNDGVNYSLWIDNIPERVASVTIIAKNSGNTTTTTSRIRHEILYMKQVLTDMPTNVVGGLSNYNVIGANTIPGYGGMINYMQSVETRFLPAFETTGATGELEMLKVANTNNFHPKTIYQALIEDGGGFDITESLSHIGTSGRETNNGYAVKFKTPVPVPATVAASEHYLIWILRD